MGRSWVRPTRTPPRSSSHDSLSRGWSGVTGRPPEPSSPLPRAAYTGATSVRACSTDSSCRSPPCRIRSTPRNAWNTSSHSSLRASGMWVSDTRPMRSGPSWVAVPSSSGGGTSLIRARPGARRGGRGRAWYQTHRPRFSRGDEAGVDEDLHVVADRGLRAPRRLHEVAGAHLAGGRGDERQQAQPDRVGQRGERLGQQRGLGPRRARRRAPARSRRAGRWRQVLARAAMGALYRRSSKKSIDDRRYVRRDCDTSKIVDVTDRPIPRSTPCPVSNSPSTSAISTRRSTFYTKLFQHPARQGPRELRQLRHRRAAAEAGAHRRRRRARHPQPRRRRGGVDRRGHGRRGPHAGRGRRRPTCRSRPRVASPCRTRCGCRVPRSRGRSTPCWPTPRSCTRPEDACCAPAAEAEPVGVGAKPAACC